MKRILILLLISVSALKMQAQSPAKVGYFNLDSLLTIMPEMKVASDSAQLYYHKLEEQLGLMQEELERKQYGLNNLRKAARAQREQEIYELQMRIEMFRSQAETDYSNYRKKLVEPIYKKIQDACKAVASEKGYDLIIDSSEATGVVMFASGANDVFPEICAKLGIPGYSPK